VTSQAKGATILRATDCYHTGVVVPDLDQAITDTSEFGGYRWTTPMAVDMTVWMPGVGVAELGIRFAYSLDAPHFELVQDIPDTPWSFVPGRAVHHVGYWVDDLRGASAALSARGRPIEVCGGRDPEDPAQFTYHLGDDGIRIELVDRTTMPDWPGFLAMFTPG
jgi:hypothetical protein